MRTRILIVTDIHYCHEIDYNQELYGNITKEEKAERTIAQIQKEYKREPYECILMLGDYSLDHWKWGTKGSYLTMGRSFTKEFFDTYLKELPAPYYIIAGNHEQFGEENWRKITGRSRECHFVLGDILFILWDSYGENLDPTEHSDGTYTPPNVEKIRALMDAFPDKKVVLASHAFIPTKHADEAALISDSRILCLFQGHTHKACIETLPDEYGNKKLIHSGAWSHLTPDSPYPWGVRDIVIEEGRLTSSYYVEEYTYQNGGKEYHIDEKIIETVEIPF